MCRRSITTKEYIELDISPPRTQIQLFPSIHGTRYLNDIRDFKTEINSQLRAPTRTPLVTLTKKLDAYLGTDFLPLDIYDNVMEFELNDMPNTRLRRYQFVKMVSSIPFFSRNRKYFKYEFEVEDDNTVFATAVYEV
jgi:hypothetical protein